MSIEQLDRIDSISIDASTMVCRLAIVDHLHWNQPHLEALQRKVNYYLQWIESGEIYLPYPQAAGCEFHIVVTAMFEPNDTAMMFIAQARQVLEASGFEFVVMPFASAYADESC